METVLFIKTFLRSVVNIQA